MSITIISRSSDRVRQAVNEHVAQKYGRYRYQLRSRYRPDEKRNEPDTIEESRAKLEKRSFFKRD
jgi:hypothetical protein